MLIAVYALGLNRIVILLPRIPDYVPNTHFSGILCKPCTPVNRIS